MVAGGIVLSWHQRYAAAMKYVAEKEVQFTHHHYVFLDFKLIVRLDLVITLVIVGLRGTSYGIPCKMQVMLYVALYHYYR